jgi:perosamine synthetase
VVGYYLNNGEDSMKKIPLAKPILGNEELQKIGEVFDSGWILNGPRVKEFENKFKEYIGCKHAIAVSSCTAGMDLALRALNVEGGEVILPAFNFIAAGIAVLQNNAKPVFVDVDEKTCNIDPEKLKKKLIKKQRRYLYVIMQDYQRIWIQYLKLQVITISL